MVVSLDHDINSLICNSLSSHLQLTGLEINNAPPNIMLSGNVS